MFPKTFIFQATIKQYQTAENIDFARVFFSLYFQICTVCQRTGYVHRTEALRAQPRPQTHDALPKQRNNDTKEK